MRSKKKQIFWTKTLTVQYLSMEFFVVVVFFHVSLPPTIISATFIYLHIQTWWIPGTFLCCFNIYTCWRKKSLTLKFVCLWVYLFHADIVHQLSGDSNEVDSIDFLTPNGYWMWMNQIDHRLRINWIR